MDVDRTCTFKSPEDALGMQTDMRQFRKFNRALLVDPLLPDDGPLILALCMVRLLPEEARRECTTGRSEAPPVKDTIRVKLLQKREKQRVITISQNTHLLDHVDSRNHIDGTFGGSLAQTMTVDNECLVGRQLVNKIFIDWNRMAGPYGRKAYIGALDMIAEMKVQSILAPDCIVYLPILFGQEADTLKYDDRDFTGKWALQRLTSVEDNPLWCVSFDAFQFTIDQSGARLNPETPFVTFRP